MLEEGNNCVFLSKYINNIAIRWDVGIPKPSFVFLWNKKTEDLERAEKEAVSEVIIQTDQKAIIFQIPQKHLLKRLSELDSQFHDWVTVPHHPVLTIKNVFKRKDFINNF